MRYIKLVEINSIWKEREQYTLFRSTVNSISLVVCTVATTIGPSKEAVVLALLDDAANYAPGDTVLLEPGNNLSERPLLGACVVVNFCSSVVPLLLSNLTARPVTVPQTKILADDSRALLVGLERSTNQPPRSNNSRIVASAFQETETTKESTQVHQAMANVDSALSPEQRSALEKLHLPYSNVFSFDPDDMGRTNVIYHTIDIGESQPVRQGLRKFSHEHISVLKNKVDKLH